LHFLPMVMATLLTMLSFSSGAAYWLLGTFFEGEARLAFQLISIGIYHYLAYKALRKQVADAEQVQLQWLRQFILLSSVLCTIVALSIYLIYVYYPALNWMRMGFLSLTLFIYWVSYAALTKPDLFSGPVLREQAILTEIAPRMQVHRPAKKYSNSNLADEEATRIVTALEQQMSSSKPYLETDLTIDKLAKLADTNRHHLSQVLNEKLGLSFYDYVNTYRVNEARLLLTDPDRAEHKIASIAYDAGFNSLSAFNDVFKKWTGQTPSGYRKQPAAQKVSNY
jgi:AraC-like DNA-binding protein